ncbi:unnamed protein product [Symbiodinium necroappetens]|uniref:Uncharacterized protein n=1 Tax=Symbiodinium necroappetens TaxID=1628268 RepID=A0A812QVU9_9DINO|nr:unnamed protein product [Symbiodinium necroappetens]
MSIEERSKRFTPRVSTAFCMARVWNGGQGGQCPLTPATRGLCQYHVDRDEEIGLNYGRVDGSIPEETLLAFEAAAGTSDTSPSKSKGQRQQRSRSGARERREASRQEMRARSKPKARPKAKAEAKEPVKADRNVHGDRPRCTSRVWAGGQGGQCARHCEVEGGLCGLHAAEAAKLGCPKHGYIHGDIPEGKYMEFKREADRRGWSTPSPQAPPPGPSGAKQKRPVGRPRK